MSDRFDGVLVPAFSPEILAAFQNYHARVPLRMSQLEQRLTGVKRYKSGGYQSDYEQLARLFYSLAGVAVIVHFCDDDGARYDIWERRRPMRRTHWSWDNDEGCVALGATFEEIEGLLRGGLGEQVCVNLPSLAEAVQRLQPEDFEVGQYRLRPMLLKQAETVDRLIAHDNHGAAAKLLVTIQQQLPVVLTRTPSYILRQLIEAILESIEDA